MEHQALHHRSKKTLFSAIGITIILLIAIVFLWLGNHNSIQSTMPIIAGVSFQGEYRIEDGEWLPIIKGKHIPSTKGDVTLRGFFQIHDPYTNEPIEPLQNGTSVFLYFNHINGAVHLPNGYVFESEAENSYLGEDSCATMWGSFVLEGLTPESNDITIVLHNPHRFGNENAIDDFLENMTLASEIHLEKIMLPKGEGERNIGLFILISSLIVLGIAAFATIIHIKYYKTLWLIGLIFFFAGGYFLLDAFAVSLWNDSHIFNTRALGLCMMFYMQATTALISTLMKDKVQKVAFLSVVFTSISALVCICLSFLESVYFFDTWGYFVIVESVAALVLIVCLIISFPHSSALQKGLYTIGVLILSIFLLDVLATKVGWWQGGMISKYAFLVVFAMALVVVLRVIPAHINAASRARELEAEQQALKLELQESRISIMLSQMQPHFIFNTLNTIYHLCEIDPNIARSTISSFSEYLRNNIDNLGTSEMISFEKELSFVKTYLDIEKVRFDDELEITFDIETTDFKLPVLSIQPIVENAVKHGTSKKEGISQLVISTKEHKDRYEITIRDTGVGFNTEKYATDGHKHIGISSVRERLANLCDGTLSIESTIDVGTTATIKIPKKEVK